MCHGLPLLSVILTIAWNWLDAISQDQQGMEPELDRRNLKRAGIYTVFGFRLSVFG
jgi:type II secretory pathway component PulJ